MSRRNEKGNKKGARKESNYYYYKQKRTEQDTGKTRTRTISIIIQKKNDENKTIRVLLLLSQKLNNKQDKIQQ